jgi:restriction system protein
MARYKRRKKKGFEQEIFGLVIILSVAASYSLPLREVIFSFAKFVIFALVIVGVVVVICKVKKVSPSDYLPTPAKPRGGQAGSKSNKNYENHMVGSTVGAGCTASSDWAFGHVGNTQPIAWTIELLRSLEWKRFETVCSEYLKIIGHDANETRIGPDGGVDIIVHKVGQEKPLAIVQCKAWSKRHKVGVKPIRELFGIMAAEQVVNGMFITTGDYTSDAIEFATGKSLKLITGERLLEVIRQLSAERKARLLALATEGDYTTPTCPQCGIKMTTRTSSKGRNTGNQFWGCVKYPKCRSTLVFR